MASLLFQLTAADLQKKLVPRAGLASFSIGDVEGDESTPGDDMPTDDAEAVLNDKEEEVLGRILPRYRQLMRKVDGEILTACAAGGETTFNLSLFPVTVGTLKLYRNFPEARIYENRDDSLAMAAGTFSVDEESGVVTLTTALVRGESLWAEYDHTGAGKVRQAKEWALTLAAVEIGRRFSLFPDSDKLEVWEKAVSDSIRGLKGIDVLDNIRLVREDTDGDQFFQRVNMLGGGSGGLTLNGPQYDMGTKRMV